MMMIVLWAFVIIAASSLRLPLVSAAAFYRRNNDIKLPTTLWTLRRSHLFIRGGHQIHTIANGSSVDKSPKPIEKDINYLTLGLVHLASLFETDDCVQTEPSTLSSSQMDATNSISNVVWSFIQTKMFYPDDTAVAHSVLPMFTSPACILAIPLQDDSTHQTANTQSSFTSKSLKNIQNASLGHVLETIGSLSDIIVLVLPPVTESSSDENRSTQLNKLVYKYMHRVLQGIKRQSPGRCRNLILFLVSYTTKMDSIFIEKVEQQEEDDDFNPWTRNHTVESGVDVYTLQIPFTQKQDPVPPLLMESILVPWGTLLQSSFQDDSSLKQQQHDRIIPIPLFPTLVQQVYQKLSRPLSGDKDYDDDASQDHVDANIITFSREMPWIIPPLEGNHNVPRIQDNGIPEEETPGVENKNPIEKESIIDWEHIFHDMALQLQDKINNLEKKQDDVLLDMDRRMPILEFGQDANEILLDAGILFDQYTSHTALGEGEMDMDTSLLQEKRNEFLKRIAGDNGIRRLFRQQLESLREYYGRRYELLVSEIETSDSSTEAHSRSTKEEQRLIDAASKITESFRVAALNAVPQLCKEGMPLHDTDGGYGYVDVLAGLIRDMTDVSSSFQRVNDAWDSANDIEQEDGGLEEGSSNKGPWYSRVINIFKMKKRQRPAKWYEKLASRAITLAINYLQGWLAWQGLKKAAEERDRNVPKFPLF